MQKVQRRDFLKWTAAGTVAPAAGLAQTAAPAEKAAAPAGKFSAYERVTLGKTGIKPSRLSFGTGVRSFNRNSEILRKGGRDYAVKVVRAAYERGVRCFDMADLYGSHQFVAEALAPFPRDSYVLFSKIWWRGGGVPDADKGTPDVLVDRFLRELKTDYVDLVHLHCVDNGTWPQDLASQMETLEKVKKAGKIRAHGISIHAFSALHAAPGVEWLDAVHVRINPFGSKMAGPVDKNMEEITKLHGEGKGIIAMKVIGEGDFSKDSDKINQSLSFLLKSGVIDVLNIGFVSVEEVDDIARRIAAIDK
ncbi:MAG: aldo/keto reductase [Kiritimatiellae bacterium]|nr:aldo/keto reductase [Kiritimatiellia bacterium]